MAVDYDLVVIGGTTAGRRAAAMAARLQARVALVEPKGSERERGKVELARVHALSQLARQVYQRYCTLIPGSPAAIAPEASSPIPEFNWTEIGQWLEAAAVQGAIQDSLPSLATQGVDVIAGSGEFRHRPNLAFVVKQRTLRSRAYLLALAPRPIIPAIDGLNATGFLTAESLTAETVPHRFEHLAIMGSGPVAAELAQSFVRLGCQVTLLVRSSYLMPRQDPDLAQLIQGQLEAEGVRVLTQCRVREVQPRDGKKWIQIGNEEALLADEILLAIGQSLDVSGLNLDAAAVKYDRFRLQRNQHLQTTNRRVYLCGAPQRDYLSLALANHEAEIAVKNALFWPRFKPQDDIVPSVALTDPEAAWIGAAEPEKPKSKGKTAIALFQPLYSVERAQLNSTITGFCKLHLQADGKILGAQLVGAQAGELIHAIALAKQQGLSVDALAKLPWAFPTLSEIYRQLAEQWQQQQPTRHRRWFDWLSCLFAWRRDRAI